MAFKNYPLNNSNDEQLFFTELQAKFGAEQQPITVPLSTAAHIVQWLKISNS